VNLKGQFIQNSVIVYSLPMVCLYLTQTWVDITQHISRVHQGWEL